MSRFDNIPKDEKLTSIITLALKQSDISLSLPRGTTRKLVTKNLGLKTTKEFNNYLLPFESKYFRIEELFLILDVLENDEQKLILDYIANKYDFILSHAAAANTNITNLDNSLFNINSLVGKLNQKYLEYKTSDDKLDELEIENLLSNSYHVRQALIDNENKLRSLLHD
jgi:hypothetical protein